MSNRSYVTLKQRLLGEASVAALAETFRALGDTTRVRMLDALARTELCVQDLADLLGLTQSAVSHQLRLLRGMRLVRARRDGRLVFYALDDDHIVKLFKQGLEHVEEKAPAAALRPSVLNTRERHGASASARDSLEPLRGVKTPSNRSGGGVHAAIRKRGAPRESKKRWHA